MIGANLTVRLRMLAGIESGRALREESLKIPTHMLSLALLLVLALPSRGVSVREFGAEGNGTANDTVAFGKALASGAKDIYLPAGTYRIGPDALNVPAEVYLHGDGPASKLVLAADTGVLFNLSDGVTLARFAIEGKVGKRGEVSDGVVHLGWGADRCRVEAVEFRDCDRACIVTDHGNDLSVRDCTFTKVGLAVSLQYSQRIKIQDNTVVDCRLHGIQFWGNWKWEAKGASDLVITGNYVRNGGGGAIWGTGATRVIAANNIIDGASDVGIDLEWCDDSVIQGNTVRNCENAGISLFFSCQRISITGNTVINDRPISDPKAEWWVRSGIWLTFPNREQFKGDTGHRDVTIVGNTILCGAGERRALWIGSESENVTLAGNTIRNGQIMTGGIHKVNPMVLRKVEDNVVIGASGGN